MFAEATSEDDPSNIDPLTLLPCATGRNGRSRRVGDAAYLVGCDNNLGLIVVDDVGRLPPTACAVARQRSGAPQSLPRNRPRPTAFAGGGTRLRESRPSTTMRDYRERNAGDVSLTARQGMPPLWMGPRH